MFASALAYNPRLYRGLFMSDRQDQGGAWQLDRKIPVALIMTLLIQTAGFAFWVGQLSIRIDQLELQSQRYLTNGDRLTRLEVRIENLIETVRELDRQQ